MSQVFVEDLANHRVTKDKEVQCTASLLHLSCQSPFAAICSCGFLLLLRGREYYSIPNNDAGEGVFLTFHT